ncbi:MAG: hypothetical protein RL757_2659 [Bacteroidota bacterium]|jgi:hypothetical protein
MSPPQYPSRFSSKKGRLYWGGHFFLKKKNGKAYFFMDRNDGFESWF